ncbi:MAG TPA: hypothetical protein VF006_27460 [Longimicrobium sp.]
MNDSFISRSAKRHSAPAVIVAHLQSFLFAREPPMSVPPIRLLLVLATSVALADALPAAAQRPEPDSAEVVAYRMTDEALDQVRAASQAAIENLGRDPEGARATGEDLPEDVGIITRMEHEFSRRPAIRAAVESSGLTIREFTHFWIAVAFSQMVADSGEGDPQGQLGWYPAENVRFYRRHREEIDALYAAVQAAGQAAERAREEQP